MKTELLKFEYGIFDTDGTLLDNRKLYRWILPKILSLGFSTKDAELYLPTGGLPIPSWTKFLQKIPGLTQLVLVAEKVILKLADFLDVSRPRLFEGAGEIISLLNQRNLKLFATTGSKTEKANRQLEKVELLGLFTAVAGSEIPKREHIPYFANKVGLPIEEFAKRTFLVSDGPVDLDLAAKYGVYSVGVTHTLNENLLLKSGAKEIISNLRELL